MRVEALWLYPLKGGGSLEVEELRFDRTGPLLDRRWMAVDAAGRFVSQRELPRMAWIRPRQGPEGLELTAPGMAPLQLEARGRPADGGVGGGEAGRAGADAGGGRVGRGGGRGGSTEGANGDAHPTAILPVTVWDDTVLAREVSPEASQWISRVLERELRLVRFDPETTHRPVSGETAPEGGTVAFADGWPLLLTTTASIEALGERIGTPVSPLRFRPNVLISGCDPFAEDRWRELRMGGMEVQVVKPCARCTVITIDPDTAEAGAEPLRTLADFRKSAGKVWFGQNALAAGMGTIRRGDPVSVLREGAPRPDLRGAP